LQRLLDLARRVGNDPLLTQASTGNCSVKLDGVLWIKASGKWMADAGREDILIPLNLAEVRECLRRQMDPADQFPGASLETALHAALPHRIALHVHCVNTIAWAVRSDAPIRLQRLLEGLPWQWIPYVASGLPLGREIEHALAARPNTDIFILGNHGVVLGGEDAEAIEGLLNELKRRVAIPPREAHPSDYTALWEISRDTCWELPDDDGIHALGTDEISQAVLGGGLLYPCQAIFTKSTAPELFRPIPYPDSGDPWQRRYANRRFLMIQGRGVIVSSAITPEELAMLSGLAQVVQRLNATAPLRYLSDAELSSIPGQVACRYWTGRTALL
jgi:rhamnose utilization protein RhaD (predicted bifunctional aldolase and dehydrogenase)